MEAVFIYLIIIAILAEVKYRSTIKDLDIVGFNLSLRLITFFLIFCGLSIILIPIMVIINLLI